MRNEITEQRNNEKTCLDQQMLVKTFQELKAWQVAHEFTLQVYRVSRSFPKEEIFGVTSQLRRSAASVPANVVEGFGRRSTNEFKRHLRISNGSLEETRYFLLLSRDLAYLSEEVYESLSQLADRAGSLLGGLERSLNRKRSASS